MMHARRRPGFTLYQLLVLLALLALLLAFLFPAIFRVRMAAQRAQSQNNLKQLGIALHNYNDAFGRLPPGVDENGFSAAARLLPFIEQDNLYKSIDFKKSIDDPANAAARKAIVKTFLSPNDPVMSVTDRYGATNYLFNAGGRPSLKNNNGIFYHNSAARIPASFQDGTSNTIVIAETLKGDGQTKATDVRRQHVLLRAAALKNLKENAGVQDFREGKNIAGNRCASWMDGHFLQGTFNSGRKPNDERPDVSCAGLGGLSGPRSLTDTINIALGDGSVRSINARKISYVTWQRAITPSDGEVLGNDW